MRAMVLHGAGEPLRLEDIPPPELTEYGLIVRVEACGVCRTDLHVVDGELNEAVLPIVCGHQVVGIVEQAGSAVTDYTTGDRVGIPWLGQSCRTCRFCQSGRENLCDRARFTGYQIHGGFAELAAADSRYVFPIAATSDPVRAAPLLCAGLIGYRALGMTGECRSLGLYGFGASAHIVAQIATHQGKAVYAFTRPGDLRGQSFARSLGAVWVGGSDQAPPQPLDAAIIFAPVGALVPTALAAVDRGGVVVCAGIHMSDIPAFPYSLLWGERMVRSVANLTRRDGEEFFALTQTIAIDTHVTTYELARAGQALDDLRAGRFEGAAVIVPGT